jgi:hypothetical protein
MHRKSNPNRQVRILRLQRTLGYLVCVAMLVGYVAQKFNW